MKNFKFLSRVMAVLCTAMLLQPMYASQENGLYFDFTGCNVDLENFTPTVFVKSTQVATATLPTVVNSGGYSKLYYDFTNRNGANVGSIDPWTGEITLTGQLGMASVTVMNYDNTSIYDSYDISVYAAFSFEK